MNPETLRRVIDRIERSLEPIAVYTNGKGVWCGVYPDDVAFDVELMGIYYAMSDSYDRDEIAAWLQADFEAAAA